MPLNPLLFCSLSSLLVFSSPVLAQTTSLLPSVSSDDHTFPSCASNCPLLQQAESSCIQNENANANANANDYAASVSCFCQSGLIDQLHHFPNGTCDDTCSSISERGLLQTWYEEFCSSQAATNVKRDPTPAEEPADGNPQTTTTSTGKVKPHYPAPPSWISTHYQWIIMVIVLIVGFTAITIVAVWLKRRHDAKYPHLYHAASRGSSGLLLNRQQQDLRYSTPTLNQQPGAFDPSIGMTEPRRFDGANTDSFASSSHTAVNTPQAGRSPFRMPRTGAQSQQSGDGDMGIREESR